MKCTALAGFDHSRDGHSIEQVEEGDEVHVRDEIVDGLVDAKLVSICDHQPEPVGEAGPAGEGEKPPKPLKPARPPKPAKA